MYFHSRKYQSLHLHGAIPIQQLFLQDPLASCQTCQTLQQIIHFPPLYLHRAKAFRPSSHLTSCFPSHIFCAWKPFLQPALECFQNSFLPHFYLSLSIRFETLWWFKLPCLSLCKLPILSTPEYPKWSRNDLQFL